MLKLMQRFFRGDDAAARDASTIYATLMRQSRNAEFYGDRRVPDTQSGRIEVLVLHIAPLMNILATHGEQGKLLSQALFDTMKQDFDTALREEGYSDSGVKRRIKPMVQRFYSGLMAYGKAFDAGDHAELTSEIAKDLEDTPGVFVDKLAIYARDFRLSLSSRSLGDIAQGRFTFPSLPA